MFIRHRPFATASAAYPYITSTSAGRLLRREAFHGGKFFAVNLMGTHFYNINVMYQAYNYVYLLYYVCIAVLTLDPGLLARSQYPEGPATGHLDTGFSWFPCVYKRMLRWFPSFQVATTCLSCSPPDLNFLVTFFPYLCTCKITTATG
jgi:hypothetical protein